MNFPHIDGNLYPKTFYILATIIIIEANLNIFKKKIWQILEQMQFSEYVKYEFNQYMWFSKYLLCMICI